MPPAEVDRPLAGKRILVTRASEDATSLRIPLQALGSDVRVLPTIDILPPDDFAPLDAALRNLERYDCIIFTSRHSVTAVFSRLAAQGLPATIPDTLLVAAVGPRTAAALNERGVKVDRTPVSASASALAAILRDDLDRKWVLFPASSLARPELKQALEVVGAWVNEVVAYRTLVPESVDQAILDELKAGTIDVVALCSPSAAHNLVTMLGSDSSLLRETRLACIGPTTAEALEKYGLHSAAVAQPHTMDGLVAAICELIVNESEVSSHE